MQLNYYHGISYSATAVLSLH